MGLFHYLWSRTAASNDTIDANINWAEGMPPSAVNNSGRAMMAACAGFRDDIAGAIVTGGTSTAYTVTSYQIFDSLAHLNGQMIAFTPHATNGATVTLNVDGLGAKPLRSSPSVELAAGTLVLGTPYTCTYNNSDSAFYLQNFYGSNPYNVPLAGGMDFWGSTVPNSSFAFPIGQAVSRTTYSTLFTLLGTTYGVGDGSTTFNLPDKTGRISAMKEASATRLTSTYFGGNSTALGATGGGESQTLTQAQLPSATLTTTVTDTHSSSFTWGQTTTNLSGGGSPVTYVATIQATGQPNSVTVAQAGSITASTALGGSGNPHPIVQPTIVCNYIMRII